MVRVELFRIRNFFIGNVVGVERGAEGGTQSGHLGHILDPDRDPGQRSHRLAARDAPLQLPGVIERPGIQGDDGVERRVDLRGPRVGGLDHLDRAGFPGKHATRDLDGRRQRRHDMGPTDSTDCTDEGLEGVGPTNR